MSENEKDGRTLIQVIRLVFEKMTDEAAWSEVYARLCRKMIETICSEVRDDVVSGTRRASLLIVVKKTLSVAGLLRR